MEISSQFLPALPPAQSAGKTRTGERSQGEPADIATTPVSTDEARTRQELQQKVQPSSRTETPDYGQLVRQARQFQISTEHTLQQDQQKAAFRPDTLSVGASKALAAYRNHGSSEEVELLPRIDSYV